MDSIASPLIDQIGRPPEGHRVVTGQIPDSSRPEAPLFSTAFGAILVGVLTEERVAVGSGVELFVASTSGPVERTLLVIHGGPTWDHTYLLDPLVRLAPKHRVVFSDLRGCGRSTTGLTAEQYTPDAVIADLTALLDHLRLDQADVLGFSYGGQLAARLALTTDRVRRLVVASSSVQAVPPDAYAGDMRRASRLSSGQIAPYGENPGADQSADALHNRAEAFANARVEVWHDDKVADYLDRLSKVRFTGDWNKPYDAGILPPARVPNAIERLAASGLPMLFLHGREDLTFPARLATVAADAIPTATAVVLDEAAHMAHVDRPDAWLDAVGNFLK